MGGGKDNELTIKFIIIHISTCAKVVIRDYMESTPANVSTKKEQSLF